MSKPTLEDNLYSYLNERKPANMQFGNYSEIELIVQHLRGIAPGDQDITVAEVTAQFAVIRYSLKDLINDLDLVMRYKGISSDLVEIIIDHIPAGKLDAFKAYLVQQVEEEKSWRVRLGQEFETKIAFNQNPQATYDFLRQRNDHALIDQEVSNLATLETRKLIYEQLVKLRNMGVVQIKDNEQNYADLDNLIVAIETIASMDYGPVNEESLAQYKIAISRLPNVWGIRESLSQEPGSVQSCLDLVSEYTQYDVTKILDALQTLADNGHVFETSNGPRTASEIIGQIKKCLTAQTIKQIRKASEGITSLYGLDQRIYKYCTERLLAAQPQTNLYSRLRSVFSKNKPKADLIDEATYNIPLKLYGRTEPL